MNSAENGRRVQISTILASGESQVVKVTTGIRVYPHKALARIAAADGVISEDDDLLQPRFYLAEGLSPGSSLALTPAHTGRPNRDHAKFNGDRTRP